MLDKDIELRANAQRNKIIEVLREAGIKGVTNIYLYSHVSKSLGARLSELYERGYNIECTNMKHGIFKYMLISEPVKQRPKPMRAEELLIQEITDHYDGSISTKDLIEILKTNDLIISRKAGAHKRKRIMENIAF